MAHLELCGVEKWYGAVPALRSLTLSVERGELLSLLGPSGCGKTTTLRIVAGLVAPSAGSVRLAGRPVERDPPHRRNVGMVFQGYALFPHMDAAANVGFGLRMRGVGGKERDERVRAALDMVGLGGLGDRFPAQLSGGQQQRVALARALVIEPDVLLLDEPLGNLDATLRAGMRAEIRRLQRRLGITTVLVTHDQEEALAMSDRVALMDRGELVEHAAPAELSERPRRRFTARFLGARTTLPGRAEGTGAGRLFAAEAGFALPMPAHAPDGATCAVLRAARLGLAREPDGGALLCVPGTVEASVYLGDAVEVTVAVTVGAGAARIRVLRPSAEPAPTPGERVYITGGPEAIAFLADAPGDGTGGQP
jgi:putative spermidine/putrescine transport system ATP-binding protein